MVCRCTHVEVVAWSKKLSVHWSVTELSVAVNGNLIQIWNAEPVLLPPNSHYSPAPITHFLPSSYVLPYCWDRLCIPLILISCLFQIFNCSINVSCLGSKVWNFLPKPVSLLVSVFRIIKLLWHSGKIIILPNLLEQSRQFHSHSPASYSFLCAYPISFFFKPDHIFGHIF